MAALSPTKYATADWHTSNFVIQSSAERQRSVAHTIRQQSEVLRNDTENRTRWTQHTSNTSVQNRVGEIENWVKTLEKTLTDVEKEIGLLAECKDKAEQALRAKVVPIDVALQCLSLREQRLGIDMVRDEVEAELHKEVGVIEGIQNILSQRITEAFQQTCALQRCHQQLHSDLKDKYSALNIDTECIQMNNLSGTVSLHPDPTRIKKGIVNPEQWCSFSAHNSASAKDEIQNSTSLRELIYQTIKQTNSDLVAQWTATNYALRKRLHQIEQIKQELEWQLKNTETEIGEVEEEVQRLEQSLADKTAPMMVAHTRLESRTYRPNVELCRDKAQYGLVDEVMEISKTKRLLQDKLEVTVQTLGTLQRTLARIQQDHGIKANSLALDQECIRMREQNLSIEGSN